MKPDDLRSVGLDFLRRVQEATSGQGAAKANLFDVGRDLGLSREKAERVCHSLLADGQLEIATLAGGVVLTETGRETLAAAGLSQAPAGQAEELVEASPLEPELQSRLEKAGLSGPELLLIREEALTELRPLVGQLGQLLAGVKLDQPAAREAAADLAGLEAQLASPRPKAVPVREGLISLLNVLAQNQGLAGEIGDRVIEVAARLRPREAG